MVFFTDLLTELITFIASSLPSNFFANQYVATSLDFFSWLGWVIFAISSIFLITGAAERKSVGEFVNLPSVCWSWFQGLLLVTFSRILVFYLYVLCHNIAFATVDLILGKLTKNVPNLNALNIITFLFTTNGLGEMMTQGLVFWIMLIASIVMFIQLLRIFGILYVQIVNGYLSIVDVMLGDGGVFYGWLRDVMANCITFALQYIFYIGGAAIVNFAGYNNLSDCAAGLVLIIAAPAIPTALKRWGFNHGGPTVSGAITGTARAVASIGMIAAG